MKEFDFYEFTAILAPGSVAVYGFARLYPELGILGGEKEVTFGEFGVLLILAYVAGHLVQSLGNGLDFLMWRRGGWPSDRIRTNPGKLLSHGQRQVLPARIRELLHIQCPDDLSNFTKSDWHPITRQVYATVRKAGCAERVDIFGGYYGMSRGVAASLIAILGAALWEFQISRIKLYVILCVLIVLSLHRMHRFGIHYSRELFVQFIAIHLPSSAPALPVTAPASEDS